jgi:hypothetical protein
MARTKKPVDGVPWACPSCGTTSRGHKKSKKLDEACESGGSCGGFICDCPDPTTATHGASLADPCPDAQCYHCGWRGIFPQPPKKMLPWEKKALSAGWAPPAWWSKQKNEEKKDG